jgi:hypothetical protein
VSSCLPLRYKLHATFLWGFSQYSQDKLVYSYSVSHYHHGHECP